KQRADLTPDLCGFSYGTLNKINANLKGRSSLWSRKYILRLGNFAFFEKQRIASCFAYRGHEVKYKKDFEESKGRGFSIVTDTPELQRLKRTQEQISNVKYHEDFEKTKGRGFTPVVDDPITERVRKNTQVVSDAAYKGVHPHIVEMDRRPGIIVAPVLPGAYQQSQSQGYGYMHQTSMSSMRSMHSQPHSAGLRTYRAMYDYSAQDEDEVSFRDGDYIINVQPIDDGWMYGTVQRTGKTGMLPANYIEFVN
uniref:SH3 domain-containing protein n=1 Tax=Dromaius novaehollandiae TaxID=8790 RepID=A0A8C4J3J6_DRONO